MDRWRTMVLAALAAAIPILAGELHGYPLSVLALLAGLVTALTVLQKKPI